MPRRSRSVGQRYKLRGWCLAACGLGHFGGDNLERGEFSFGQVVLGREFWGVVLGGVDWAYAFVFALTFAMGFSNRFSL
jgi:hypothetical protein